MYLKCVWGEYDQNTLYEILKELVKIYFKGFSSLRIFFCLLKNKSKQAKTSVFSQMMQKKHYLLKETRANCINPNKMT